MKYLFIFLLVLSTCVGCDKSYNPDTTFTPITNEEIE